VANRTGIPLVLLALRVNAPRPVRSGVLPWLNMIAPEAPAAAAFSALISNVHVPRWISAMFPAGNHAKSTAYAYG
jgi:hypothetical protein